MKKGRIFVISAPSGCGKTTICKRVLERVKNLSPSVSMTTRPPRPDERDRKDYYYTPRRSFQKEIEKGNLLEWERNFGHLYGTPKKFILEKIRNGKDILLSIDVKGAVNVKRRFPESTLIFIKPPSLEKLRERLKGRNTDKATSITKRLKVAKKELTYIPRYDHVVVNEKLEGAVNKVVSIINEAKTYGAKRRKSCS